MTTNYNLIYTNKNTQYKVGDIFSYSGDNWRLERFNGLKIIGVSFNFGDVLEFSYEEWLHARPKLKIEITTVEDCDNDADWRKSDPNIVFGNWPPIHFDTITPPTNPLTLTNK